MQKAKRRMKSIPVPAYIHNGNGVYENTERASSNPSQNSFIANIAGSYKDDPFWDEFVGHMAEFRRAELERDLRLLDEAENLTPELRSDPLLA